MTGFKVTPDEVTNYANACNSTATEIQGQLQSLKAYVQNMEDWWQGIASTTFQGLMTEYDTYSAMLYNALTDIGSGLSGNEVQYSETEKANQTTINNIQSSLSSTNFS
jgi:WXG100 family type VII secretion target